MFLSEALLFCLITGIAAFSLIDCAGALMRFLQSSSQSESRRVLFVLAISRGNEEPLRSSSRSLQHAMSISPMAAAGSG